MNPTSLVRFALAVLLALGSWPAVAPGAGKSVKVGPGVVLEIDGGRRRVVIAATVVLRKGPLEGLLTRAKKKEHEYILAADVDARHVHTALELARAKAGKPVRFAPKYLPAEGTAIRVRLRYEKGGKAVTVPANDWVRDDKTGKPLQGDWVFAGSRFGPNPEGDDKPPFYLANHGDLICVVNVESALLDLPSRSPKAFNQRLYRADTDRIPPAGTRVEVILEPVPAKN
jgi:hypothetical protein